MISGIIGFILGAASMLFCIALAQATKRDDE